MNNKNLDTIYTPKQQEIYSRCVNHDWFMLINHGAKRSGKTILNNDLFLQELLHVRQIADKFKVDMPQYILSGAKLGTIKQNILNELTNKYGIQFIFDKWGNFVLFGVYVVTCGHAVLTLLLTSASKRRTLSFSNSSGTGFLVRIGTPSVLTS